MPLDALDRQTLSGLPKISGLETAYGVKVNELSVDQLFALYERTGFLYPAKPLASQPYTSGEGENLTHLRASDSLLNVLTAGDATWVARLAV
jgi:hypothetical protein